MNTSDTSRVDRYTTTQLHNNFRRVQVTNSDQMRVEMNDASKVKLRAYQLYMDDVSGG